MDKESQHWLEAEEELKHLFPNYDWTAEWIAVSGDGNDGAVEINMFDRRRDAGYKWVHMESMVKARKSELADGETLMDSIGSEIIYKFEQFGSGRSFTK